MTIITSYDWESDSWTHNGDNPARKAWRDAVAEIAEKAKQTLPECNGRVDAAVKIVLAGDVDLLPDGTAKVASQSNGGTTYHVIHGECSCKDYPKAPHSFCKHRLSAAIARRAHELAKQRLQQLDHASTGVSQPPTAPPQEQPSAPVQAPHGEAHGLPEGLTPFIVHLHGKPFVQYAGLLKLAHDRGLVSLKAHFVSVTAELALAEAEAVFQDGKTYGECADATLQNVGSTVKAHFPRLALTRAKARTLRDARNIGIAALEELEGQ